MNIIMKRTFMTLAALSMLSLISCSTKTISFNEVRKQALEHNNFLDTLHLEKTTQDISNNINFAIQDADKKLLAVVNTPKKRRNFDNTVGIIDQIFFDFDKVGNRHYLIKSISPNKDLRASADLSVQKVNKWYNKVYFRDDLYRSFQEYASQNPQLSGEQKILFDDYKKAFKANGFHLSKRKRKKLQAIKNQLSETSNEFSNNQREFKQIVKFTKNELAGVPESALETLKKDSKENYLLDPRIVSNYLVIVKYASKGETRRKAVMARSTVAKKSNAPLMTKLVKLRLQMAKLLGYKTYADFAIEQNMAKTGSRAVKFITDLSKGLEPKFQKEQALLTRLKRDHTKESKAKLYSWDGSFYETRYLQDKFQLDEEKLKEYFPMKSVMGGMFKIFENLFSIEIKSLKLNDKWVEGLQAFVVFDKKTNEPLGTIYMDLYPREGKYSHFAHFGIVGGKVLPTGQRQRPLAVLVCNFTKPTQTKPSLLSFDHVETLFHEFGHALHNMLSKTQYASNHGTNVERDFVEAPSQMLEFWVRDKDVLDTFAKHYKTGEKIPKSLINSLFASQKVFQARQTRGQIAYAMTDLTLHTKSSIPRNFDVIKETNDVIAKYYMPRPKGSSFITSFGHLAGGYAAGYYGYQWSLAISSDLAQAFENAPNKYFDKNIGMKLRKEIYEPGGSREATISIRKFLGRDWSIDAYLNELGIQNSK